MKLDKLKTVIAQLISGADVISVKPLTGGVSADVYRVNLRQKNSGPTSVVLRIHGTNHCGHSASLEFALLQALYQQGFPVPQPLHVDTLGHDPFVLMSFVEGSSDIPAENVPDRIKIMAHTLADIHNLATDKLPELPARDNPLPELLDYLPEDPDFARLKTHLSALTATGYSDNPRLLHGDFWPANIIWQSGRIAAVIDWEDAAVGDPLSDVACTCLELRYKFGKQAGQQFADAYGQYASINPRRLALWQVYVAAAARHFMGKWGLQASLEAHMRTTALATIKEAGAQLMEQAQSV